MAEVLPLDSNVDRPQRALEAERQRAARVLRDARYYAEHKAEILARRRARYQQIKTGGTMAKRQAQARAKRIRGNTKARVQALVSNAVRNHVRSDNVESGSSGRAASSFGSKPGSRSKKSTPTGRKKSYYEQNRGAILARRREHYRMKREEIQARRRERYRMRQREKRCSLADEVMEGTNDCSVIVPNVRRARGEARCEFCLQIGPAAEFMPSMRFCSLRCSRAYSTQFRMANRVKALRNSTSDDGGLVSPTGEFEEAGYSGQRFDDSSLWNGDHGDEPPYFDPATNQFFLDQSMRAPMVLASYGLMPRASNPDGTLVFKRLPKVKLPNELSAKPAKSWSVDDCKSFLTFHGLSKEADILEDHDMDGAALLLIKLEHLVRILGLKVGPAVKLASLAKKLELTFCKS